MTKYQHHLMLFYRKAKADDRLLPSHMSMYLVLFWFWQQAGYDNAIVIFRKDIMPLTRISSLVTYHKVIRQLDEYGYIKYNPSFNYYKGSQVFLLSIC